MPPRRPTLVYIGIKGHVVALNRLTGEMVWKKELKGQYYVQVSRDQEFLYATAKGELWCLNPTDGQVIWHNNLKGMGWDLASIASDSPMMPGADIGHTAVAVVRQRQSAAAAT
jgi:outer membrane protein assembly factor BamB